MDVYVTYKKIIECSATLDVEEFAEAVEEIRKSMNYSDFYEAFPVRKGEAQEDGEDVELESEEDYRERIAEWFRNNDCVLDKVERYFDEDVSEFEDFEVSEA